MGGKIDALLNPKSVALIGASANPSKLSHIALTNLKKGKFALYPVNPKEREILGLRCYSSVSQIEGGVDIALVSLPADATLEPVRECVDKGVKIVIVTASGFRESGKVGAGLEEQLMSVVRGSKTRILGPNTMGVLVPRNGLDTFFIPLERSPRPRAGAMAIASQSGAVSVSSMERVRAAGLGVSVCIGLGNKADITENDVLSLLAADKQTCCIAMYLESFSDGKEFVHLAADIAKKKPVVLLKAGRTAAGMRAANSHTGALSKSSEALIDGALAQAGLVRAYDEEELIDTAKAFALAGQMNGDRICVVASAGGYGVIAADLVESEDHGASLQMAKLSDRTAKELKRIVPAYSSIVNPVDLTAAVTDDMYDSVMEVLLDDPNVDGILMSLELQPPNVTDRLVDVAKKASLKGSKPVAISVFAGDDTERLVKSLGEQNVLAYPSLWRAVRALAALARRGAYLRRLK